MYPVLNSEKKKFLSIIIQILICVSLYRRANMLSFCFFQSRAIFQVQPSLIQAYGLLLKASLKKTYPKVKVILFLPEIITFLYFAIVILLLPCFHQVFVAMKGWRRYLIMGYCIGNPFKDCLIFLAREIEGNCAGWFMSWGNLQRTITRNWHEYLIVRLYRMTLLLFHLLFI